MILNLRIGKGNKPLSPEGYYNRIGLSYAPLMRLFWLQGDAGIVSKPTIQEIACFLMRSNCIVGLRDKYYPVSGCIAIEYIFELDANAQTQRYRVDPSVEIDCSSATRWVKSIQKGLFNPP